MSITTLESKCSKQRNITLMPLHKYNNYYITLILINEILAKVENKSLMSVARRVILHYFLRIMPKALLWK